MFEFKFIIEQLTKLQSNIFRDLDKAGDYRRVDEGEARRIVGCERSIHKSGL